MLRHLAPALLGFIPDAAAMSFLGNESTPFSIQARGLLTPAQRADFDAMDGDASFWALSIGGL